MKRFAFVRYTLALGFLLALAITLSAAHIPQTAVPPAMRSVWSGVYTEAQAKRGADVYTDWCAHCHGKELQGDGEYAESLAGDEFLKSRNNSPVSGLFGRILNTMPDDDPGTMTPQLSADVVAYILSFNKIPAGMDELPIEMDTLRQIKIEATKPKLRSTPSSGPGR